MSIRKCETMKKMGVPGKVLCILILMLLLHKSSQQQAFNDQVIISLPKNYEIGWMKTLDDEKLISDINIPGTHDSLALHGGKAAECQAWSIDNQLNAGIRYFDLRVSGDKMKVVHGPISQHTTFFKALSKIKVFLSRFKTETVFVRVKPKNKVPDHVITQLEQDTNNWVREKIPKIKEVRGKVVFLQKNKFNLGVVLHETDKHGDYKVRHVDKKKNTIIAHLKEALEKCKINRIVLNYSSGTGWPVGRPDNSPKKVAEEINHWLYDILKDAFDMKIKLCFGVIAMDFPGFDLIQMVINFNKLV